MKRYGKKIRWTPKAAAGFGLALFVMLALTQVPDYVSVWFWGPNTGHRIAGLSNGHYEQHIPGNLQGAPTIGYVLLGRGERLVVDYDRTVNEGKLSFAVWQWPIVANRPRYIGPAMIQESGKGRIVFVAGQAGYYRLYMYAHRWQGDVSIDWRTEEDAVRSAGRAQD